MKRLMGKVALITGGARGQGRAIAIKFAGEGADIVLADVAENIPSSDYALASDSDLQRTAKEIQEMGQRCLARIADVRDQSALDGAVSQGIEQFGKIDILIANAGILHSKPYWEITEQEWTDLMDVNLTGAWHSAKAVARHMIERLTGTIVFTSSIRGLEAGMNLAHYVASKHGVLGLMKSVALELAPFGVRVNAVLPSGVHTQMGDNPMERARIVGHEGATPDEYIEASRRWYALRGR